MKKEVTKSVAKGMKAALDVVLRTEANTVWWTLAQVTIRSPIPDRP